MDIFCWFWDSRWKEILTLFPVAHPHTSVESLSWVVRPLFSYGVSKMSTIFTNFAWRNLSAYYEFTEKLFLVTTDNTSNMDTMLVELENIARTGGIYFDDTNFKVWWFALILNLCCQDFICNRVAKTATVAKKQVMTTKTMKNQKSRSDRRTSCLWFSNWERVLWPL